MTTMKKTATQSTQVGSVGAADAKVMSAPELQLLAQILGAGLPVPRYGSKQWRFHPRRRWRADFAWPRHGLNGVIVEVEGGYWQKARTKDGQETGHSAGHAHPARFEADVEKYNEATLAGITVVRVTPAMIRDGRALEYVKRALYMGAER
jgi:hypothetical protein